MPLAQFLFHTIFLEKLFCFLRDGHYFTKDVIFKTSRALKKLLETEAVVLTFIYKY